MRATEQRALEAIRNITAETGYPPSPEELANVLGVSLPSLQSALIHAKHNGRVGYDDEGNLVAALVPPVTEREDTEAPGE